MKAPTRAARRSGRAAPARAVIGVLIVIASATAAFAPAWISHADTTPSPVPVETQTPPAPPEPEQPTDEPTPTDEPAPDPLPTDLPEPTESASPAPTATPTVTPTPAPSPSTTPVPAIPPVITTANIDVPMLIIAALTLVAGGLLLWALVRREPSPAAVPVEGPREAEPAPVVLDAMASLGAAMIDSGYPVGPTRRALEEMAESAGLPAAQAVTFPTSIMVSFGATDAVASPAAAVQTRVVSAGDSATLLYQVDAVDRIAGLARTGDRSASWVLRALGRIRSLPAPFSRLQRLGAYALLSAALAVLLGSSWMGVALAAALGIGVGGLLLSSENLDAVRKALIVVAAALGVGIVVFVVARYVDLQVMPAAIAPLIMLLPGGLLTIGVVELATGDIMSGAARVAAGAMRLLLLSAGLVAAGALVGVPAVPTGQWPLGPFMPWIAVGAFGLGMGVYLCARPTSIGWIVIVLYVAYAAQVVGDVFVDGVLSALVGAAAMTPVAVVLSRLRTGPPAFVSFLPAFWLLVPGALGLIGAAGVLEGDSSGMATLITTLATMVSVALGVLIGLAATGSFHGLRHSGPDDWLRQQVDDDAASGRLGPR